MTSLSTSTSRASRPEDGGNRTRTLDVLTFALIGATSVVTAALYPRLPARMPIHFDVRGVADGWAGKGFGAWLMPLTMLGVVAFIRVGARFLAPSWRARTATSAASLLLLIVTVGMLAIHFLMLRVALTGAASMGASLGVVLGAFWLALGLVMPRLRRNPWMGFRTPWTLSSDENWARTHRVAGIAMTVAGLVAIAAALAGSMATALVAVIASGLGPLAYSFLLARKLE
jgi:uncharacterized membrane protein